jgi:transcriptional regulator with XRE-family HTH domain
MPRTSASPADAANVGLELRAARERTGLSQTALAERLAVSAGYVSNLEAGRSNPTVGTLARLASAMGCRLSVGFEPTQHATVGAIDLLSGTEEPSPAQTG